MNEVYSRSFVDREEQFQDRWTTFGKQTGIQKIYKRLSAERLQEFWIFKDYDCDFLERISPDICVAIWEKERVIFEEGSFTDLAFFIVQGNVNIYIQKQRQIAAQTKLDRNLRNGSSRNGKLSLNNGTVFNSQITQLKSNGRVTFLSSMDLDLPQGDTLTLGPGEVFGEMGSSIGWPQSVTAQTVSECALIQVRTPALEQMKRKSRALKDRLNLLYLERSLAGQLKNTPLFQDCSEKFIDQFKQTVELKSYIRGEKIEQQDEPTDAVYLVRAGFVKLSQRVGSGEIVVNYLGKGMLLGEIELLMKHNVWLHTATSVENTELVRISHDDFNDLLTKYPKVRKQIWDSSAKRVRESGLSKKSIVRSEFLETALQTGLVEGNSTLVIDLDVCTRCDDCVAGCSDTHDNLPRFVREGEKYYNFLITRSCYHCQDPVCLIGCPTGAIRRAGVGEVVEIDEELCIGCKACYHKCPYDAITMVETQALWGGSYAQPKRIRSDITELATKCDLCYDAGHSPACVDNCPQGCAIRVDSIEKFAQLISSSEKRHKFWRSFRLGKLSRMSGGARIFLLSTAICAAAYVYNLFTSPIDAGNFWGLTYGSCATFFMTGVALYGIRRRKIKFATKHGLGSARKWLQFHLYGGGLFLMLVFMHSGFGIPNGALYLWLWLLSIWVTASGILGLVLQQWIPKILSSGLAIEVVYERIPELTRKIRKNAAALVEGCSQPVKDFYVKRIATSIKRPTLKLIYFFDITGGIQRRVQQFDFLKKVLCEDELKKFKELELMYKSKLELDAHYTLQKVLRIWLVTHLPVSIILLVLVAIHLFAVWYY